jgi:hypothetical protein
MSAAIAERCPVADSFGRNCLELSDGSRLPLPIPPETVEFCLPGNSREILQGRVVAAYDGSTRTGAIWCGEPVPSWHLLQPCLREDFFDRLVPIFVSQFVEDPTRNFSVR